QLADGLAFLLYSDYADEGGQPGELRVQGVVQHSPEEQRGVEVIDWQAFGHAADDTGGNGGGIGPRRRNLFFTAPESLPLPSPGSCSTVPQGPAAACRPRLQARSTLGT